MSASWESGESIGAGRADGLNGQIRLMAQMARYIANGPIHCSKIVVPLWDTRIDNDPQRLSGPVIRGKNDGRICLRWPHQGCMRR